MKNLESTKGDIRILENYKISNKLSMGIGGKVSHFSEAFYEEDIRYLYKYSITNSLPFYVLGGGSNMLFSDDSHRCLMMKLSLKGIKVLKSDSSYVQLKVLAGEDWDEFVKYCIKNNYWGCENLSLIPGSVGATPVQNVGAFGQEVKNIIESVRCYDTVEDCFVEIQNSKCEFKFRSSIFNSKFKGRYIICSVIFKLNTSPKPCLKRNEFSNLRSIDKNMHGLQSIIRERVVSYRTSGKNLPTGSEFGSAGTFFRTGIVNSFTDFAKILFKTIINLGPIAGAMIIVFAIKYKTKEGFKIPSRLLIKICGLSNLKSGSFFLLPTNPACLVSRLNNKPLSKDLVIIIDTVIDTVYKKTGVIIPIEPEMIGFSFLKAK